MLLRNQLVVGFLLVALIPTLLFSVFYAGNTIETIKDNYAENRMRVLSQIAGGVTGQIQWVRAVHNQLVFDGGLMEILNRAPENARKYDRAYGETLDRVGAVFSYTPIGTYMNALIIRGDNGAELRFGKDAGNLDLSDVVETGWFRATERDGDAFRWSPLMPNVSRYSNSKRIIGLYLQLFDSMSGLRRGYALMLFDPGLFEAGYRDLVALEGDAFYAFGEHGALMSTNRPEDGFANTASFAAAYGIDSKRLARMTGDDMEDGVASGMPESFSMTRDGITRLVTWERSADGWLLVEVLPLTDIASQKAVLLRSVAVLALLAVLVALVVSLFLSRALTRPIDRIVRRVREIGLGRFGGEGEVGLAGASKPSLAVLGTAGVTSHSEIGILDESIRVMQQDIGTLMEENIRKERDRRRLEIQMLQSQINPHFLHNTINTIRMMATLQRSDGIVAMLNALGGVMKYALGSSDEMVPLRSELDVLEEYVYINRIRYKGRIGFEKAVDDERLLDCPVPRFVLQPVVENAIQHGLGPRKSPGMIRLRVTSDSVKMRIEISDNGAGMSPERLSALRAGLGIGASSETASGTASEPASGTDQDESAQARDPAVAATAADAASAGASSAGSQTPPHAASRDGHSGLGLANVQQRIRLLYGQGHGLEIDSVEGVGTRMTLVLGLKPDMAGTEGGAACDS